MSPMMLQYFDIKKQYEDHLLFYRLGDFYELFFDDAKTASRELDLTLTSRDCGEGEKAPMCGVPFHSCDPYIARLIEKGYKVAICEQTVDPATCKGIVPREVIRIVTPGTVTLGEALDEGKNNFLAALLREGNEAAVSFCDLAEGTVTVHLFSASEEGELSRLCRNELASFQPREILTNLRRPEMPLLWESFDADALLVSEGKEDLFRPEALYLITEQFGNDAAGTAPSPLAARAAAGLIGYLKLTQKTALASLRRLEIKDAARTLGIDAASRRNLELCETMRHGEKRGSLFWVLDKTRTSAGRRLLRRWIEQPLTDPRQIAARQEAVKEFFDSVLFRDAVRNVLSQTQDMERILSHILYSGGNPKDLAALGASMGLLPDVADALAAASSSLLKEKRDLLEKVILPGTDELYGILSCAIKKDPPFSVREGGFIEKGYNAELDELNSLMKESKMYLERIESAEKEATGIKNLRIGYNRVFGYYLEVSHSQLSLVPERYIRRQTLSTGERFVTQELKDLEGRILGAQNRAVTLEYDLFCEIVEKVKEKAALLQGASALLAELDVLADLGEVAVKNRYVCPTVDASEELVIRDGRHPVVEQVSGDFFVPNDAELNTAEKRMNIITGPNMAGKSTYMRQVALIVLMAQMGSFVPASSAVIGVVDKIFTRVGAGDDLSTGKSTFMLEMSEVAAILKNATRKSLIIYDEIGRGTSTYDGMSIARAVVEYTAGKKCGARTLFATHYHELSELENTLNGVKNYNIAAKKKGDTVLFLRKIVPGPADDSYGIEVARLAGVPKEVTARAEKILSGLNAAAPQPLAAPRREEEELPIFDGLKDELIRELSLLSCDTLTPIEALGKLYEFSKRAKEI